MIKPDDSDLRDQIAQLLQRCPGAEQVAAEQGLLILAGHIASMRWAVDLMATARWPTPAPVADVPAESTPEAK